MSSFLHGKTITDELRDDWHQERRFRIGASEIASALGINQYDSQLRLWLTKTGKLPPKEDSEASLIGRLIEPFILEMYQVQTQKNVVRTQVFHVAAKYDYLCATLDGITADGVNVQVKNVGCLSAPYWGEAGTDDIPHSYLLQVQQEMLCAELELTHVAALIGGNDFRIYPIVRDERLIKHVIQRGREFIEKIQTLEYPTPDQDRDQRLVMHLFEECDGIVEFDEKLSADAIRWQRLGQEIKLLEKEREQLKMALTLAMGNASRAKLSNGQWFYRNLINVAASVIERKGYKMIKFFLKGEIHG